MNDLQSQHPHHRIIEVADESLAYRQVTVEDNTPTGAQISAASGFKPDQLPVVLMLLSDGSLEDIRPDEVVDLGSEVRRFIIVESDRTYLFTIDGTRMEWPCRLITGYVVRKLGNVDDNKKLLLEREDEADLEIQNDQFIDLDGDGIERFISRKASWKLNVQGKEFTFDTPTIVIRDAVIRAGLNPGQAWHIFLKVEGQPKVEKNIDDVIDLRTPGIEKLRLTPKDVNNGEASGVTRREFSLLPADEQYLDGMGYSWETYLSGNARWLIIHDYELPEGYNHHKIKLALLITSGYPVNMLDMFYVYPPLSRVNGVNIPATEATAVIDSVAYQRWSRHRSWDPETDSVISQLAMADGCLQKEAGQ
ncbi:multiubiquitin domain-containing protein [Raoultella planticola]|uniref:multiubiquitin domain-containing protein n=1 Tax=Enterobacterales TaxID=91347 RepID=UPI00034AB5E9|nr:MULTISPECIES: multiubiquitin domain-containing protein [Enterobacterales]HCI6736243.1 multiubiquitin domain-containing protein [Klebsiella quasipneumoniae subsp. quasipneumoniae]MCS7489906.1 multiubiquitin domain-containing protein [Raoultella planticola]MDC3907862.1 multiubiquitin domain-containing protein [Raoultella planticola]PLO01514.1 prokaryotic E2 family E [Klebsiella michiganensis]QHP53715.1 prokaryotic E2 family E [Pectobacterium carotovorum subsp. carotovorum]